MDESEGEDESEGVDESEGEAESEGWAESEGFNNFFLSFKTESSEPSFNKSG